MCGVQIVVLRTHDLIDGKLSPTRKVRTLSQHLPYQIYPLLIATAKPKNPLNLNRLEQVMIQLFKQQPTSISVIYRRFGLPCPEPEGQILHLLSVTILLPKWTIEQVPIRKVFADQLTGLACPRVKQMRVTR